MSKRPINPINPLEPVLAQSRPLILDGGLATELEARGHDLSDELWSARLLVVAPDDIRSLHYDYLKAGADCIISASYQGTIEGFMALGLSRNQAVSLLELSAELAIEARDDFWNEPNNRLSRIKPIVAASVGPYGAYLADGSEFTGDYDLDEAGLLEFHRERWQILASTGADILACETIPSLAEARALGVLLQESENRFAWLSFSCKDGKHISDGTPLAEAAMVADAIENVAAIGINCTAPRYVSSLIAEIRKASQKPVIVYPNSGETYDSEERRWRGDAEVEEYIQGSISWRTEGASLIGGCCRTGPEHIRRVRQSLVG